MNTLKIGDTIADRYNLEELISEAENSLLFKCTDTRLDIKNAIKILIPPNTLNDEGKKKLVDDFINVAKKQARLKHPNIVHVVNIDARQGLAFIVMEIIQGQTFYNFFNENTQLSITQTLDIILPIVDAILFANDESIIHKNLNAANIIICKHINRYSPKVLNFSVPRTTSILNTQSALPFLSPEQLQNYHNADTRSDIFSIGVLLYFALTHKLPFGELNLQNLINTYANNTPFPPLPNNIPENLKTIIYKCCQINPNNRFNSLTELTSQLKQITNPQNSSSIIEAPTSIFDVTESFAIEKYLKLNHYIASNNDAFIFDATLHDPQFRGMSFKTKFISTQKPDQKQSFINGMQIQQYLAQYTPYIQPIFMRYDDIPAYITIAENAQSLQQIIQNSGPLDPKFAVHSFTFISEALLLAQQNNYFHASIHPNNIFFVNRDNYLIPMLYDFAQHAFHATDISDINPENAFFIAPELNYQKNAVNIASEVYSFGMSLIYAILGKSPFRAQSPQELKIELLATQKTPNIADLYPNIHPSLAQFITWCTDYNPAKRYNNFLNLCSDIITIGQIL